ncbi:unnamed protein product [Pylaiella littoralis]
MAPAPDWAPARVPDSENASRREEGFNKFSRSFNVHVF